MCTPEQLAMDHNVKIDHIERSLLSISIALTNHNWLTKTEVCFNVVGLGTYCNPAGRTFEITGPTGYIAT